MDSTMILPMFGCFAGSGSAEIRGILTFLAIAWVACLVLGIANACLVALLSRARKLPGDILFFVAYAVAILTIFTGWIWNFPFAVLIIFAVPVCVIAHFISLLYRRDAVRRRRANAPST